MSQSLDADEDHDAKAIKMHRLFSENSQTKNYSILLLIHVMFHNSEISATIDMLSGIVFLTPTLLNVTNEFFPDNEYHNHTAQYVQSDLESALSVKEMFFPKRYL